MNNAIGEFIGLVLALALDIVVFGAIAAIPLAALVVIGIIAKSSAVVGVIIVAGIAAMRVLLVAALRWI